MFAYPKIIPTIILFLCINIACQSPEKIDLGEVPVFSGAAPSQPSDFSLANDAETQSITDNESTPSSEFESADSNMANDTDAQSIIANGNSNLLTTGFTEQTSESSQNEIKSGNDNLPTTVYTKTVQPLSHVAPPTTIP